MLWWRVTNTGREKLLGGSFFYEEKKGFEIINKTTYLDGNPKKEGKWRYTLEIFSR